MESQENEHNLKLTKESEIKKERTILVVISSINNSYSSHLNKKFSQNENDKREVTDLNNSKSIEEDIFIYDVNSLANKLTADQIDCLTKELLMSLEDKESNYDWVAPWEDLDSDIDDNRSCEEDKLYQGLNSRNKNQKLNHDKIKHIRKYIDGGDLTTKQLSIKFNLSASLISKIKRMDESEIMRGPIREIIKLNLLQKKTLSKGINCIFENNDYAIDCNDITICINDMLNTNYPIYLIWGFIKKELNYSYKRIKLRSSNADMKRIKSIRSLYSVKLRQTITSNTLIVNIDESSLNRHIKNNYEFSIKGVLWELKNFSFLGNASLCMTIC